MTSPCVTAQSPSSHSSARMCAGRAGTACVCAQASLIRLLSTKPRACCAAGQATSICMRTGDARAWRAAYHVVGHSHTIERRGLGCIAVHNHEPGEGGAMSLRCLHSQPAGQHRQPLLNLASRQHKVHDGQVATQTAACCQHPADGGLGAAGAAGRRRARHALAACALLQVWTAALAVTACRDGAGKGSGHAAGASLLQLLKSSLTQPH